MRKRNRKPEPDPRSSSLARHFYATKENTRERNIGGQIVQVVPLSVISSRQLVANQPHERPHFAKGGARVIAYEE